MAITGQFTAGSSASKALTDFNNVVNKLNAGIIVPYGTAAEIKAYLTANPTTRILIFNTSDSQLEFWNGLNDGRVLG